MIHFILGSVLGFLWYCSSGYLSNPWLRFGSGGGVPQGRSCSPYETIAIHIISSSQQKVSSNKVTSYHSYHERNDDYNNWEQHQTQVTPVEETNRDTDPMPLAIIRMMVTRT